MQSILIYFIIFAILIVICGAMYYCVYKSLINNSLKNYQEGRPASGRRLPSFSNISLCLIIILLVGYYIYQAGQTQNLVNKIESLQGQVSMLNNNVNGLESRLEYQFIKENCPVEACSIGVKSIDYSKLTMDVEVKLTLKSVDSAATISISYLGQETRMEPYSSGKYKGIITLSSFDEENDSLLVSIASDSVVENTEIDSNLFYIPSADDLWDEAFLDFYPKELYGEQTDSKINFNSDFSFETHSDYSKITSADLVFLEKGEEKERISFSDLIDGKRTDFSKNVSISFQCKDANSLAIRLYVTDNKGFQYKVPIGWNIDTKNDSVGENFNSYEVYDSTGKLLTTLFF